MTIRFLEGVRVIELGSQFSSPFCSKLLADYGADVIKIEKPKSGDSARRHGPFAGNIAHPEKSIPFLYLNTNKRGITLDIESTTGRQILESLLETADILVENFRPSTSDNLGLAPQTLSVRYPNLIVTSITPFGYSGPYMNMEYTDIVICALSGLMYHSGDSDQEPLRNVLNQSFYVAGINAAVGTLAATFQRLTTGEGQHVDV